jgi:Na+-driven multidrug efflux pump
LGIIERMKNKPSTVAKWVIYIFALALFQPSTMYLCLRVLHWDFFLSAFLAAAVAVGAGRLGIWIWNRRADNSTKSL